MPPATTTMERRSQAPSVFDQVRELVRELAGWPNVTTPTPEQLRQAAERHGTRTEFGNTAYTSAVRSRSAWLTADLWESPPPGTAAITDPRQQALVKNAPQTVAKLRRHLQRVPIVKVERTIGSNPQWTPHCTSYVSLCRPEAARIPHLWGQLLFPPSTTPGPQQTVIYVAEWQEKDRQILVFPELNTALVLGVDYVGEVKMGHLRQAMYNAKLSGMLGLHAGAKLIKAKDAKTGRLKRYGMIIFGLTATGKTTHTCHDHGLTQPGEGVAIMQDDIVLLTKEAAVLGTENGFYLKTDGLTRETQPLIYGAVTAKRSGLENVLVDAQGAVDFKDETLTSNARAIVLREDFGAAAAPSVNLPSVAELDGLIVAFITRRNTVVPIVSKLTLEQAAAVFMLGESVESSGGDPKRAGESVREVGMNPFIMGDPAAEGNRFYQLLQPYADKVQCYLLNTGGVGEIMDVGADGTKTIRQKVTRVDIAEMAAIIRAMVRGAITWTPEPHFGTLVPQHVDGVAMDRFALSRFYTPPQVEALVKALNQERRAHLARFTSLHPAIVRAAPVCS